MPKHFVKKNGKVSIYEGKTGRPKGRPSKFTNDLQNHAVTLSEIGLNNHEIAIDLGIPDGTFHRWLTSFPDFRKKLDDHRNKMLKDAQSCIGLRIKGYTYKEKIIESKELEVIDSKTGEREMGGVREIKKKFVEHHYPPDTKAAMYILDKRSKHFRRQPEGIDQEVKNETFNVTVNEIKPPKEKK